LKLFTLTLITVVITYLPCSPYAQVNWTQYPGNPVLDLGPSGSWDEGTAFLQSVIIVDDTLKMWYSGKSDSHIFNNNFSIGYAWSIDSINWTKYSGNPIMAGRPGIWDEVGVQHPVVILDGDTLRMWYESFTASTPAGPGHMIGYATSVDGITWTRRDTPVLERGPTGEWDDSYLVTGTIIKEGNIFNMWFSGGTGGTFPNAMMRAGLATSIDGINWTKYDDAATTDPPFQFSDPVLPLGGPGSWDALWAWTPSVLTTSSGYEMWYEGISIPTDNAAVGYAISNDGINWIKDSNNPVLVGQPGSWASALGATSIIKYDNVYRMWVSGLPDFFPFPGRVGYATAPDEDPSGIEEYSSDEMPGIFTLQQNYPNPFNPSTIIEYSLPKYGFVTLKVYDMLGREIATLVNEEIPSGNHKFEFNAGDLVSGIYYYRIKVGTDFVETKKMILLK